MQISYAEGPESESARAHRHPKHSASIKRSLFPLDFIPQAKKGEKKFHNLIRLEQITSHLPGRRLSRTKHKLNKLINYNFFPTIFSPRPTEVGLRAKERVALKKIPMRVSE